MAEEPAPRKANGQEARRSPDDVVKWFIERIWERFPKTRWIWLSLIFIMVVFFAVWSQLPDTRKEATID